MLKISSELVFIGDFNIDMMNYVDGNLHDSNNHLSGFVIAFVLQIQSRKLQESPRQVKP